MDSMPGSGKAVKHDRSDPEFPPSQKAFPTTAEVPVPGAAVPRFEIAHWREQYGIIAGITARGGETGRGFDLGLWSKEPIAEVMNRWLAFRRAMKEFDGVVLGNQVHGVEVGLAGAVRGWNQIEGIDGWITTHAGVLLTVTVADCVPVYLAVPGRAIALLHAGWRGTAGGILGRGVERLLSVAGSAPAKVVMHCGVGICGPCYEVGHEVMLGCGIAAKGAGPWHLDLRERLLSQARALGITQLQTSSWCTAHHRDAFFSHRASQGQDGRMVAYMGMLPSGNSTLTPSSSPRNI
jgi:purine-nucleoside/S-methyl-5'-thioadenosine phosphorylase / adenosine deaminase